MHEGGGEPKSKGLGADGLLSYLIAGKNGAKMGHPHKGNDEGNGKGNRPTSAIKKADMGHQTTAPDTRYLSGLVGVGRVSGCLEFCFLC